MDYVSDKKVQGANALK